MTSRFGSPNLIHTGYTVGQVRELAGNYSEWREWRPLGLADWIVLDALDLLIETMGDDDE
jgi:hypothetical protein